MTFIHERNKPPQTEGRYCVKKHRKILQWLPKWHLPAPVEDHQYYNTHIFFSASILTRFMTYKVLRFNHSLVKKKKYNYNTDKTGGRLNSFIIMIRMKRGEVKTTFTISKFWRPRIKHIKHLVNIQSEGEFWWKDSRFESKYYKVRHYYVITKF